MRAVDLWFEQAVEVAKLWFEQAMEVVDLLLVSVMFVYQWLMTVMTFADLFSAWRLQRWMKTLNHHDRDSSRFVH